jgi:hypothetical protein
VRVSSGAARVEHAVGRTLVPLAALVALPASLPVMFLLPAILTAPPPPPPDLPLPFAGPAANGLVAMVYFLSWVVEDQVRWLQAKKSPPSCEAGGLNP